MAQPASVPAPVAPPLTRGEDTTGSLRRVRGARPGRAVRVIPDIERASAAAALHHPLMPDLGPRGTGPTVPLVPAGTSRTVRFEAVKVHRTIHATTPAISATPRPLVPSRLAARPDLPLVSPPVDRSETLPYVRPAAPAVAPAPDTEALRRQVEERVERTLVERVEKLVTRELAIQSTPLSRLAESVAAELSDTLALERERMGWS